ncbi:MULTISPECIES: HNH endonuclease [Sphingobacterium]|uniref:HNH endonuclease n=1 Tax=Sphingobacterium litopenaei TaxID=2763500 RepID=A0ABR7YIM0_9SPHI|nr:MULTISPECIES: HNH endonuclease [Sphingobacterium]MBD1431104.1 HNH endonuclease [Sphingobacterium litopenaei]NGM74187.1 HNH endonuclease [Sphingobacterium sp. SGL-16]
MNTKVYYGEKLFDPRWIAKRKHILNRDQFKCVHCKRSEVKLHVHHRQYHIIKRLNVHADPWDYADNLLITLCESCHSKGHRLYEVPIKYI